MPQYHFNVINGSVCTDEVGMTLLDIKAAMVMANQEAGQLLKDGKDDLWCDGEWRLEVTDDVGLIQFSLMFSRCNASSVSR
jgi:hypothetical protein